MKRGLFSEVKVRRGILFSYVVLALIKTQKSGYEIIKDISEKTNGKWVPSKGALYPLLKDMEKKGTIKLANSGVRGKRTYALTKDGYKAIDELKKRKLKFRERMKQLRPLRLAFLPKGEREVVEKSLDIHDVALEKLKGNGNRIGLILDECLTKLRKI